MVRQFIERFFEHVERILVAIGVTQHLRLSQNELHALLVVRSYRCGGLQVRTALFELALFGKRIGDTALGAQVVIAARHLPEPVARFGITLLLIHHLAQIQQHEVAVARLTIERAFQIFFRACVVTRIERQQAQRVEHIGIVRRVALYPHKLVARFGVFFLRDQGARQGETRLGRSRVEFEIRGQFGRGLGG